MTELISIRESSKHVDEEVRMHVWLTDKRSSGKIDAESSWWETACEDRKLPRETRVRRKSGSFWFLFFFFLPSKKPS
ncbi:hypothetical protein ACIA4C_05065 [Lactobacillus delbrueckii subsp. allosunkii]